MHLQTKCAITSQNLRRKRRNAYGASPSCASWNASCPCYACAAGENIQNDELGTRGKGAHTGHLQLVLPKKFQSHPFISIYAKKGILVFLS
eukprot:1157505-Pelagomonas_calceolata.AAC.2